MKDLIYCLIFLMPFHLNAQKKATAFKSLSITYDDVENLELTIAGGGLTNHYTKFDISVSAGKWYVLKKRISYSPTSPIPIETSRREISADSIRRLIQYLHDSDEGVDVNLFELNRDSLIKHFDLAQNPIRQRDRGRFIMRVDDPQSLKEALWMTFRQRLKDDNITYSILVRLSDGKVLRLNSVSGTSFNLPWHYNGKRIYNPNITSSFDYLVGEEYLIESRKMWLYKDLVMQLSKPSLEN